MVNIGLTVFLDSSIQDAGPNNQSGSTFAHTDKENRNRSTQPIYSAGPGSITDPVSRYSATDRLARSDKAPMNIAGRAAELRHSSDGSGRERPPAYPTGRLPSSAGLSSREMKEQNPAVTDPIPQKSPNEAKVDKGKGKTRTNTVIELDDDSSDHDSIKDDSDGSAPHVQTSRSSTRARIRTVQGSSASRAIPVGNTQARMEMFEDTSKSQGTTIHHKPPSHNVNASPDSFSLESKSNDRSDKMVSRMQSRSSAPAASSKQKSRTLRRSHCILNLRHVITEDGVYRAGDVGLQLAVSIDRRNQYFAIRGETSSVTRGQVDKPAIGDIVINPGHISRITAPKDGNAPLTFLRIDIDGEADLSESTSPKSSFCTSMLLFA